MRYTPRAGSNDGTGAAVGVAIRDPFPFGLLLAIPVVVGGLLVMGALILLWRSFCEFYVAIFKISEDLAVLRADVHVALIVLAHAVGVHPRCAGQRFADPRRH